MFKLHLLAVNCTANSRARQPAVQVNVAHSFLYRFAVEHIFMPVECCRLLKLSHPFSKWTRPSPRTNQKAHQTIAFMNNCKRCAWENTNLSNWHKYMFNWQKVFKGMGYSCLYIFFYRPLTYLESLHAIDVDKFPSSDQLFIMNWQRVQGKWN